MKKFLKLVSIFVFAIIITFSTIEFYLQKAFENDVHYNDYVNAYHRVHSLQFNADKLLNELTAKNELTFDPTNASKLVEVVANLKNPEVGKKPVLILGSSQLIVVNDDWTYHKHGKTAGEVIERSYPEYELYNLSMAIMNYNEKEIVLRKLLQLVDFEKVLIFVTPLDLFNEDIRPEIERLKDITIEELKARRTQPRVQANINRDSTEDKSASTVLANFPVNRDLLKIWLKDKIAQYKRPDSLQQQRPLSWEPVFSKFDSLAVAEWTTSESKSGDHSLYLKNSGTAEFEWSTVNSIALKEPSNTITFGITYKTKNIDSCKLCALDFQVLFADHSVEYYYQNLQFKQGTNDWTELRDTARFDKKVISIKPSILFYSGSGELWIDNILAIPGDSLMEVSNVIPNSDVELQEEVNRVDTYHYSLEQWNKITEKGTKLINSLVAEKQNYNFEASIIVTPIYNEPNKFPYNEALYNDFVRNLRQQCHQNDIHFLDASRILEPKHFSVYDSGPKQGLIDIHHFDSHGHEILAEFLIKNLF